MQYSSHDMQAVLRPTITDGTIIIRDKPETSLAGLNRDIEKAREITKNEKVNVDVYIDPAAIEEVASGFEGIRENINGLSADIKELVGKYAGATKKLPPEYQHLGKAGLTAIDNMLANGVSQEDVTKAMSDPKFQNLLNDFANLEKSFSNHKQAQGAELNVNPNGEVSYVVGSAFPENTGQYTFYLLSKTHEYIESIGSETQRAAVLFGLQLAMGGPVKMAVSTVKDYVLDAVFGDVKQQLVDNATTYLLFGKGYQSTLEQESSPEVKEGLKNLIADNGRVVEFGLSLVGIIGGVGVKKLASSANKPIKTPKIKDNYIAEVEKTAKNYKDSRPPLRENPQHKPGEGLHNDKTLLPKNSAEVFNKSIPDKNGKNWYGYDKESGAIFRYGTDNQGGVHFNGRSDKGSGLKDMPKEIKTAFGITKGY